MRHVCCVHWFCDGHTEIEKAEIRTIVGARLGHSFNNKYGIGSDYGFIDDDMENMMLITETHEIDDS